MKLVAVPEFDDSSYRVKAIFRPVVVVIVLPPLYAVCKVLDELEHLVT